MTKSPFLPVVGPVRKPTVMGIPVPTHAIYPHTYDNYECTEHRFEARYDGLDLTEEYNLRVAIGALRLLSAKWRAK